MRGDNCTKDLTEAYLSGEAREIIWSDAQQAARAYWCDTCACMPDWKEQRFRVAVPIMQPNSVSSKWEWRRQCSVTTLGELLLILGEHCTEAQIYSLYRTLRIVAVKRQETLGTARPSNTRRHHGL